jgi:hypothetical protein
MRLPILRRLADANALTDWLVDAAPGARAIYHEGHLAGDLSPFNRTLSSEQRSELAMLASAAWRLCERGLVHLVQQRIAAGTCAYLVIARPQAALHIHGVPVRTSPIPVARDTPSSSLNRSCA